MKSISRLFLLLLLLCILYVPVARSQSDFQSGILIPVFPGATLNTDIDEEDRKVCCNFVSKESFDKVVAYYEGALKIKPLDLNGLEAQLPFMKSQADMMRQQMPQGMKIKFFILKVVEFQGQKGAEIFEVVYTGPNGVEFTIMESQLVEGDKHFTSEFQIETSGEPKPVDPQLIIKALPSEGPAGFNKEEVAIDQMPNNPTSVSISFNKLLKKGKGGEEGSEDITSRISVIISEATPEFYEGMIKVERANEKAVTINGKYKGLEVIEKNNYGCQGGSIRFVVNNRFLVEVSESSICDLNILYQLIDKMNLETLPK